MGSKLTFWLMVVVVAIIGIWAFKAASGAWGPQGLKEFAAQI